MDKEAQWKKHQGFAYKLAKRFAIVYGKEVEDLVGDAQIGIAKAIGPGGSFNPSKGAESTWVHQCIYWELMSVCAGRKRITEISLSGMTNDEDEVQFEPEDKPNWTDELLKEVGEEARHLLKTIVDAPAEILDLMAPSLCAKARDAVKCYLIDEMDWEKKQFQNAWKEIEVCLSSQN